ncbi:hypothetical protein COLO4_22303 [Corchorus olitorius]|uniref:Uncharacterized protein n=1 Tax=Corchorus olitorius TaxID=93759 RepID=A0A1R3IN07_9ROSI|nr:hypothetical protein COLO4_22303 [Corchorus olitorius]
MISKLKQSSMEGSLFATSTSVWKVSVRVQQQVGEVRDRLQRMVGDVQEIYWRRSGWGEGTGNEGLGSDGIGSYL